MSLNPNPMHALDPMLDAIVDRIVPGGETPGAREAGTAAYVRARLAADPSAADTVARGAAALDETARWRFGVAFAALDPARQDEMLAAEARAPWFAALAEWTTEGFYADEGSGGNAGNHSWTALGYDPRLPPVGPLVSPSATAGLDEIDEVHDVIVVGAGAGGGVVACVLAEAGHRVLLLERGPGDPTTLGMARDHLRNQRLSAYGHNAGPDIEGHPRVVVEPGGGERVVRPHENGYQNNAAVVGSGTVVYGAQAWRFHPDDFRMASRYGSPEGSSLADWPFDYGEIEPWYERAEWEIGVAGSPSGQHAPRRRGYPMPPVPGYASRRVLERGAAAIGIPTVIPPLLINTAPRHGRAACAECGSCVGFACPVDAKNGTQNTVIPRALATGRCTLATSATVSRVNVDSRGVVRGVTVVGNAGGRTLERSFRARAVVLCAGAIETARLMLNSACDAAPGGLGNANGWVGRNLQGHFSPMVYGRFEEPVYDPRGPGVSIASTAFNHGNPGLIGGSMMADDFIMLPVIFWKRAMPGDAPRWGLAAKEEMQRSYRYVSRLFSPVQEIPTLDSRVSVDPAVRDRFGIPVARLSGVVHPETMRTALFMRERALDWLRASGATRTWHDPLVFRLSAGQHQAGTCRMGTDPTTSVTDPWGRVWGHDNLFVADGSLHPTNGGFNPVLTILALAFRTAEHVSRHI
ncbi:GMC oxidoreductase [Alsobacter sp. SYSU M60028]|uniref:GMC oxidoreductase n=1 Tax=Alsobacter ponti TaxID=2962936 RepID=A0ABT1LBZ2_9HYPH|nr:GMC family oxidoreductase [Alsobacter ponti]MCP8938563.1 GMC oxidoreductase [Alsobacter ponti]